MADTGKVDLQSLAALVERLFDLSMDADVSGVDRQALLAAGRRLRAAFVNVASARFDDGLPGLLAANGALQHSVELAERSRQRVEGTRRLLDSVGKALDALDGLLDVAKHL